MSKKKKQKKVVAIDETNTSIPFLGQSAVFRMFLDRSGMMSFGSTEKPAEKVDLLKGLEDIEMPEEFESSVKEMEKPDPDLHTYVDAHASAVKNCPHENVTEVMYQRQWQCQDCTKYLDRAAMIERQQRGRWGG